VTITITGWFFMVLAWATILGLNVWCFYRIFRENPARVADIPDIETEIDRLG
jgi:hypothetical protein